jgi:(2R)-ethylmalonyl-CoA mutase
MSADTNAGKPVKDRPWVMRTYAGHSSATESNKLYRTNLAKGQTGLSVAFDLPTQTGYDPDSPLSRGEVGKVGVPIPHLGEMRRLFADIPLVEMNTSMTINATAMWLLALYQVVAEEQALAADPDADFREVHAKLAGTTQNDIIKEYLSRGTYVFPPEHSMRLTADTIAYTVNNIPKWNPINICSYHLQEAGATPTQELAFALCTAIAVLDAVKDSGQVSDEDFEKVVGRISFFVNAGVRFVEEMCKMRAFVELWDEITSERYGVKDEKMRRFRYGVQVNSLGLTEAQPENNIQRIVLEMLGVTLSKNARARAVQLPAWNEALGLPRPWDQQWSLRLQQVLAYESDLLEYADIFDGSVVIEAKVAQMVSDARAEIDRIQAMGGAVAAVESGYMKQELVSAHSARRARIESGEDVVVGVNKFETTEPSPLTADLDAAIQTADPEGDRLGRGVEGRARRGGGARCPVGARRGREDRGQPDDRHACRGARGCHHRRVGRHPARGLRRVPGADRCRRCGRGGRGGCRADPRSGECAGHRRGARRPSSAAGRQARAGRALQRRRAGRGARPRRWLRGRLPGHPADAGADCRRGRGRGRALRRPVDPVRVTHGAGARRTRPDAQERARGRAGHRRRDHPRLRRQAAARARGGGGVHAEGLQPHRGDGGHRHRDPEGARPAGLNNPGPCDIRACPICPAAAAGSVALSGRSGGAD